MDEFGCGQQRPNLTEKFQITWSKVNLPTYFLQHTAVDRR